MVPSGERIRGGGCPGNDVPRPPLPWVDDEVHERRECRVDHPLDELVEPRDDGVWIVVLEGERAEGVAKLAHHRGGLHAFADDVADDEPDRSVLELDDVVPVSADVDAHGAREVPGRQRYPADRRQALRENAALHRLRDSALGLVASGAVDRLLALADQGEQPFAICVGDGRGGQLQRESAARERERDPAAVDRGGPPSTKARRDRLLRSSRNLPVGAFETNRRNDGDAVERGVLAVAAQDDEAREGPDSGRRMLETGAAHILER